MFLKLVVLLSVVSVALAGMSAAPLQPKPDKFKNEQGCYIEDLDRVIPFGQAAPDTKYCMEYRCGSTYLEYVTCATAGSTRPPCRLEEDHSKPYPDCCPKIVCP